MGIELENNAEFSRLCQEMIDITGREAVQIVKNAGKDYVRAAFRETPLAPKFKPYTPVLWQGEIVAWIKHKSIIRGRGYAKAGWIAPMRALGVNGIDWTGNAKGINDASNQSEYKESGDNWSKTIEMANKIPYIDKLDNRNGIDKAGTDAALAKLSGGLEKLKAKLENKWK